MPHPPRGLAEVWTIIDGLPEAERRALILVCVLGLSYAEAATAMGSDLPAFRSALSRARRSLADHRVEF